MMRYFVIKQVLNSRLGTSTYLSRSKHYLYHPNRSELFKHLDTYTDHDKITLLNETKKNLEQYYPKKVIDTITSQELANDMKVISSYSDTKECTIEQNIRLRTYIKLMLSNEHLHMSDEVISELYSILEKNDAIRK